MVQQRLAVVTGAARGIGACAARQLAAAGWSLVMVDACAPQWPADYPMPSPRDLDEVADDCRDILRGTGTVDCLITDVADASVREALSDVLGGRVPAAAVAVAGVIRGDLAWAASDEAASDDAFDLMIRVNLYGVRHLAQICVPPMIEAGAGRFVAVSSAAALRAMPKLAAYSASKAAVVGYVRALAADLAGTGVTANVICPGSTRGAMLAASASVYDLPDSETFAAQALLRRLLEPEEVAATLAWLCGPEAGALTGAVLPVDGGLSALAAALPGSCTLAGWRRPISNVRGCPIGGLGASAGGGQMAIQDALPWPPPAPPTRLDRGRRRGSLRGRPRLTLALGAVAAAGLVAGLLLWAPWHQVPVPPAAVHAQSPTATSVLVSWSASKGGATVNRYLVLRDGVQVGSVPASRTSYADTGLAPGTAHRYTIVAVSGTQRSSPSVKAGVTTITPSPIGLTVGQQSFTSAVLHWSPSPEGPVPDEYTIYDGSAPVAFVPGTTDSYSVTALTPGSSNQYEVTARWGERESDRSAVLSVVPMAPPLQGSVPVQLTTVSTPGGGASLHRGQKWSDTWAFTANCAENRCTLTADANFAAPGFSVQPFTMTLTAAGAGYAGSAKAKITRCRSVNVQNTVTLRITADKGAVDNGGWNAWNGTMVLSSPYVTADSSYYCPAQSWNFSVTGTHS